jgi:hypothetical protein
MKHTYLFGFILLFACCNNQNPPQQENVLDSNTTAMNAADSVAQIVPYDTNQDTSYYNQEEEVDLERYGIFGKWFVPKAGIYLILKDNWEFAIEGLEPSKLIEGKYEYEGYNGKEGLVLNFNEPQQGSKGDLIEGKNVKSIKLNAHYDKESQSFYLIKDDYNFVKGD